MLLRLLCLVFFSLLIYLLFSQVKNESYKFFYKKAEALYNSDAADAVTDSVALDYYQKIISRLHNTNENDSVLFDCYLKAGIILSGENKDAKALRFFLQSIILNNKSSFLPDSVSFRSYLFAGNNYDNLLNLDSALYCYKQAEVLLTKYPGVPEAERLYNKTGVLYYETGDFKKSVFYFQKALAIAKQQSAGNNYLIVNYKNNIASAYRKLQQYSQALTTYESLLKYKINYNELLHNIGVTYFEAGDYHSAINYLRRVANNTASKFNDIGRAYLELQQYDSAQTNFHVALNVSRAASVGKNADYSEALKNNGDLLLKLNRPEESLKYYQQAIIQVTPGFNDTLLSANPFSVNSLQHSFYLFEVLIKKAEVFNILFSSHNNVQYLLNAYQAYKAAIKLSEAMERFYGSDESKFFLKKNAADAYQLTVETALKLYQATNKSNYLQDAFTFIENSKASVLRANLNELELSTIKELPVKLISEEKNLKAAISKLELQSSQITYSISLFALQEKIRDLEIQLAKLQNKLDEDKKYHELRFYSNSILIDSLQKNIIEKDEAILSYYTTKKNLVVFYITKENYGFFQSPLENLKKNVLELRTALNQPQSSDRITSQKLITALSGKLIKPVFDKIKTAKRLIVIPYNEICYIPFEIFYEPSTDNILLNRFAISYNYSINFLSSNDNNTNNFSVLSVAPFINETTQKGFAPLKASLDEIKNLKGKQLLSENATKQQFITDASTCPVIHLATHAVANDTTPLHSFIAFYPEKNDTAWHLYEPEIYYLNLTHTQLVVLSACETGSGEIMNGEGIMSLSRAFSYAGCKSVITSLWKADDIATSFITKCMHTYLEKGAAKDEALQKAKLDYLNSDDIEARYKIPSYWAHLVLIGDNHSIITKHYYWLWIVLAGAAAITLLLLKQLFKNNADKSTKHLHRFK